ncbi:hypothetical protein EZS27_000049 [termite gut metagenome]|uniref:Glycosyltransferase subfamily 4-like N-terminal domain-containing protein n=1 Tax=termite gut metagenome TaxID=433724 RepID=A0A5J4T2Q0_9ZZZZ
MINDNQSNQLPLNKIKARVFFLAPSYLNLYKEIVCELEKQNYEIYTVSDIIFRFDPYFKDSRFKKMKYICIKAISRRYWKRMIRHKVEFNKQYDILFCVNGYSIDKILLNHLKKKNPYIKCILYLWDSNNYYNFSRNFHLFDKVITFDRIDSIHFNIEYLPFFLVDKGQNEQTNKYQICFIGSNHDDRYWIVKNIVKQLDEMNISYYIKLFIPERKPSFRSKIRYLCYRLYSSHYIKKIEEWNLIYGKYIPSFVTNHLFSPQQFSHVLNESFCVLDTDRECQSGLTPRLIWALAANKKIITTNVDVVNHPFYSSDRICIIDRNRPQVSYEFINTPINNECNDFMQELLKLRIDNWIETVLRFDVINEAYIY